MLLNPASMFTAGEIRIAVVLATKIVFQRVIRKAADQIAAVRPTKTNRVVESSLMRKTIVRETGRDVEDIARLKIFINDWLERIDMQQCRMRAELAHRQLIAHTPAAAAHPLDNKDVILVDMRANAAARHGVGDHQIIKAPGGQHAKRLHQLGGRRMPVVYRLRQQGPVALA